MMDNPALRRLVTVSSIYVVLVVYTLFLPLLLTLALAVDAGRFARDRTPAMAVRIVAFGWAYVVGEAWAILALAAVALTGRQRSLAMTYRLQNSWAKWNFNAFSIVFDVDFAIEGADEPIPPPFLVLARHASLVDSLLPILLVAAPHRIHLRYILKKELLVDPALDIAGNRIPNYFIDRATSDLDGEIAAMKQLASGMADDEGLVIFPEGTRFSERKRQQVQARHEGRTGKISELSRSYRRVLPPRPAGTLALLAESEADILVLAHRGLEGFARVADVWGGGLVGSRIDVAMWRVDRVGIPLERSAQIEWLYRLWADVDAWVVSKETTVTALEA